MLISARHLVALLVLVLYSSLSLAETVSIHLKWYHKFQFAGYYAALEQGYFEDEGLDVHPQRRSH